MGQYYRPTLITPDGRLMCLHPNEFDSFSKLTEHSWISNDFVNAVYSLIYKSRKRVAWMGDYACDDYDPVNEPYAQVMPFGKFKRYRNAVWGKKSKSISSKLFSTQDFSILDFSTKGMYLVNHNKQIFINLETFISDNTTRGGDWNGWCVNPLPLLTACGNGRGGGDYHKDCIGYSYIGTWAFDWLEYTDKIPDGYTEEKYYFSEHGDVEEDAA